MVDIRAATAADSTGIAGVHVRSWREAYAGIVPDEVLAALDVDARAHAHATLLAAQDARGQMTRVAVAGERIVGFAQCGPYRIDHETVDPDIGEVCAIYVDPPALHTGVGAALMSASMDWAAGRNFSEVRLWVLRDNARARRFYQRCGFAPDGATHTFPVGRGEGRVDLPELRYARRPPR